MSTSRSHRAAAARAKRSAESIIGECPVVDMTVDVERGRHEEALTPARVAALEVMTSVLFAHTQAAGVLFAHPSKSAVRASTRKPMCAEESSHIDSYA